MNKFIRNNFLAISITLAVIYAFAKKATIFQQEAKPKPAVVALINQEMNKTFTDYWKNGKIETTKYDLKEDSISVGEGSLTFSIDYVEGVNKSDSIQVLYSDFIGKIHKDIYLLISHFALMR
jgi:predicted membrane protein